MKHYLLNHQPQKGLQAACAQQGQAPTCNARGKGHTSASPKTLTRILLVLLTMLLLPSAAWGQITVAGNSPNQSGNITGTGITGTVTYSNGTLTLTGAEITGDIVWNPSTDLTINLSGTNTLTGAISTEDISSTVETNLSFTGSTGSLEITAESSDFPSAINGTFKTIDFGNFNLATSSPGAYWDGGRMADYSGSGVTNLKITSEVYYPIWVMYKQGTPEHTQLTSKTSSVAMVREIDNTDVVICTVSYDATSGILTIGANEEAENNGYAFQPGENAAIVVGSSLEELTVHLVGDTKITDENSYIFSAWNTTSLIFTTDENSPGSLTGTKIVDWKSKNSEGTGQISCKKGLVYNAKTNPQTISTDGVRLKIGDKEVRASENITIAGGTASFDAKDNTLTLTEATIGEAASEIEIQVFVDEFNLKISGTCTINGSITYSGNSGQSSSIKINNAEEDTPASLTMKNIEQFGACTWGDGLYLSANNSVDVRYEFENGEGAFRSYYGEISTVTISTNLSYPLWINGIQATEGSVTGTGIAKNGESVSEWGITFIPATNTLKLQNVLLSTNKDQTPAIISGLDNLNIQIEGNNNVNIPGSSGGYTALSTKSNAVLTITTEDDGRLNTTNGSSSYSANPFHGFKSVTFNGDLIYIGGSGYQYIRNLGDPGISLSSENKLKLSSSHDDYGSHYVSYYYTLDFADSDENDIRTPTLLSKDEEGPTIAEACTITAYISYEYKGNEYNDYEYGTLKKTGENNPAIGKYFAIADKTIVFNDKTKGTPFTVNNTELTENNLEIIPATEGEGVSFSPKFANNQDVISFIGETEPKFSIAGIGICEVGVKIDVENPTIQVLNPVPVEGDITAKGIVTVIPDEPKITITKNDPERNYYLNTDEIAITRTIVEGENTGNIKIFYTWAGTAPKIGSDYTHDTANPTLTIYDNTKPIPAQTGTLWTWVGYQLAVNEYLMSEVASQALTVKTDISDYTVQGLATSATYTGAAIVPAFSVKASADAETSLTLNTDYTVSYQSVIIAAGDVGSGPSINYTDVDEMVEVGAYRIVITGTGDNYGGTTYADFAIDKADLDIVTIEAIADQTYTGSEITPEITVKLNGNTLSASDYGFSIGYSNNINVATSTSANAPTVTITATEGSNYFTAGTTKVANFNIVQKSLTDESISVTLSASSFTYNGNIQYPEITVKDGETTLTSEAYGYSYSQDGTAVDGPATAGTYTLTIYGKGNYTGEITKEITITPKEIATADITVTLATTSYTFDGTEHKPEVSSVTISDVTDPIEYEDAVYTNNVNAALATATENAPTVTVSLKGNYSGTGVATFTIEQADLSDYVVTGLTTPTAYTGSPITPTFSVKATETAETSLTANTDYSVKYQQAGADVDEMKDAGNYKILITGEGNYKGSLDADFTIDRAQLNLTINLEGWAYGDTPNEPSLEGNLGKGKITWEFKAAGAEAYSAWSALTATTDAGTYMVKATVAETDNYEGGSKEAEFVIAQYDLANATVTLDPEELVYNGEVQTVKVTKVMAGDIEVDPSYYEISGNTGKEAKTYSLTVIAKTEDSSGNPIKNNFKNSKTVDWVIKNRTVTISELGVSESQPQGTYYSETEDLEVPEGVVAYIITGVNGNNVVTQRIRYIPKRVAVFVEQTTSTENPLEVIPDASELPLKGTAVDLNVASISGGTVYVLYKGEFVKSTTGTIPAKRCYLLLPNNVAAGTRAFGIIGGGSDGSTAIKSINDEPSTIDNWYDMGGHRIEKPTKTGIYIKNGKKVAIK